MNTNHYPDLQRCKKLTEIGFPQTEMGIAINYAYSDKVPTIERWINHEAVSNCPSVMEMLDVIPKHVKYGDDYPLLELYPSTIPTEKKWFACYIDLSTGHKIDSSLDTEAQTLPNALADLIFWLHENNYIKF